MVNKGGSNRGIVVGYLPNNALLVSGIVVHEIVMMVNKGGSYCD